jgi:thymidylate kinase
MIFSLCFSYLKFMKNQQNLKTKKINLYGGPGIGKSTLTAILFSELKMRGLHAEIVTEYAKELVYEGIDLTKSSPTLQDRIILEQLRRELVFENSVDYLVCDSPMMLNAFYNGSEMSLTLAKKSVDKDDVHILLVRGFEKFETLGRSHNEKQSKEIDDKMENFLKDNKIKYHKLDGSTKGKVDEILHILGLI